MRPPGGVQDQLPAGTAGRGRPVRGRVLRDAELHGVPEQVSIERAGAGQESRTCLTWCVHTQLAAGTVPVPDVPVRAGAQLRRLRAHHGGRVCGALRRHHAALPHAQPPYHQQA